MVIWLLGYQGKESEELAAWMLMDLPEKKPKVMRMQKAKASAKAKSAATAKCKGKAKPKRSAKAKAEAAPAKEATAFPKTSWWHRKSSAAYHKAKKAAEKLGLSPQSAKKAGRDARADLAEKLDSGEIEPSQ